METFGSVLGWPKPAAAADVVNLIAHGWDGSRLPVNAAADDYGSAARLRLTVQGWGLAGRLQDFATDYVVSPVDPTRFNVPREMRRAAAVVDAQATGDSLDRLLRAGAERAAPFRPRLALESRLLPGGLAEFVTFAHRLDPFLGDWFSTFAPWIFTRRQAALAQPKGGAERRWGALERAREREVLPVVVRQWEAAEQDAQTLTRAPKYPDWQPPDPAPRLGVW